MGLLHIQKEYASEVAETLSKANLYAEVDNSDNTLQKKIRNGEIAQYNFILGTLGFLLPLIAPPP